MSLMAEAGNGEAFLGIGFGLFALLAIAWLVFVMAPTWIAMLRGHPNWIPIAVVNFFLSWTGIAWIACLAWSLSSIDTGEVVVVRRRRRYRD